MSRNSANNSSTVPTAPAVDTPDTVAAVPAVIESWVETYRAAGDAKARAAVRKTVTQLAAAALQQVNLQNPQSLIEAQSLAMTVNALTVSTEKSARETVPAEVVIARRIITLRLAAVALRRGLTVPEGMESVDTELIATAIAGVDVADDELNAAAMKLASAKITRSTERHAIIDVLDRAFDGLPVGEIMKISDVVNGGSTDDYRPSAGAVRATFDKNGLKGAYRLLPAEGSDPWRVQFVGE